MVWRPITRRVALVAALVALTLGTAWKITPHPAEVCAVTIHVDGTWSTADPTDTDALHYAC